MFYSGYGVMCSIQEKKYEYIKDMPKNRILKTLILFDFFYYLSPQTYPTFGYWYCLIEKLLLLWKINI